MVHLASRRQPRRGRSTTQGSASTGPRGPAARELDRRGALGTWAQPTSHLFVRRYFAWLV